MNFYYLFLFYTTIFYLALTTFIYRPALITFLWHYIFITIGFIFGTLLCGSKSLIGLDDFMTLLKMPFFGFGQNSSTAKQTVDQQKVSAAENELDMVTDLFTRLVDVCHQKCIPSIYTDGELNKGESVCIDRCVYKFFEVNIKIGEHMQSLSEHTKPSMGQAFTK